MTDRFREEFSIQTELSTSQLQEVLRQRGYPPVLPNYLQLIDQLSIHRKELRKNFPNLAKGTFRLAADKLHRVKGHNVPTIEQVVTLEDRELLEVFPGVGPKIIEAWNILITHFFNRTAARE